MVMFVPVYTSNSSAPQHLIIHAHMHKGVKQSVSSVVVTKIVRSGDLGVIARFIITVSGMCSAQEGPRVPLIACFYWPCLSTTPNLCHVLLQLRMLKLNIGKGRRFHEHNIDIMFV